MGMREKKEYGRKRNRDHTPKILRRTLHDLTAPHRAIEGVVVAQECRVEEGAPGAGEGVFDALGLFMLQLTGVLSLLKSFAMTRDYFMGDRVGEI